MKKDFEAKVDSLRSCLEWILSQLEPVGFSSQQLQKIELASEEAIINIISHGNVEIIGVEIQAVLRSHVEICITDTGAAFNPLENKPIDPTLKEEEREIGGLGIHFIRKCMDEVRYERKSNQNILTLVKRVSTHSSQKK